MPYANRPEESFAALAKSAGWMVTKRGWPDFFCVSPGGGIIAVEVKPPHPTKGMARLLKPEQYRVMEALERFGMEVRISDGTSLGAPVDFLEQAKRRQRRRLASPKHV